MPLFKLDSYKLKNVMRVFYVIYFVFIKDSFSVKLVFSICFTLNIVITVKAQKKFLYVKTAYFGMNKQLLVYT